MRTTPWQFPRRLCASQQWATRCCRGGRRAHDTVRRKRFGEAPRSPPHIQRGSPQERHQGDDHLHPSWSLQLLGTQRTGREPVHSGSLWWAAVSCPTTRHATVCSKSIMRLSVRKVAVAFSPCHTGAVLSKWTLPPCSRTATAKKRRSVDMLSAIRSLTQALCQVHVRLTIHEATSMRDVCQSQDRPRLCGLATLWPPRKVRRLRVDRILSGSWTLATASSRTMMHVSASSRDTFAPSRKLVGVWR
mmetsp:Transcript_16378/g.44420  ORF Transcript_16378/g.44420 Transcript_16378/m.44420 type:complete len:246 (-) Transcript_16378:1366-2103(-)